MRRTDASYTYSLPTFMSSVLEQPDAGQTWVMLVDGESYCLDRDLFSDSPTKTAQQSLFPTSDTPMTESADPEARQPSTTLSPSSMTFSRQSTASSILSIGQELAHILSRFSYTDPRGDVIPPIHLQAIDILVFDYHVLTIGVRQDDEGDQNLSIVTKKDVPTHLLLGLNRRPSAPAPDPQTLASAAQQLGSPEDGSGELADETPWRDTFVACLRYDNTIRDARGKRAVKVIWDYDEMMTQKRNGDKKGKGKARDFEDGNLALSTEIRAIDSELLRNQYERASRPPKNDRPDHQMPGMLPPQPTTSSKPQETLQLDIAHLVSPSPGGTAEEHQQVTQFWQRMQQRDQEFEEERARLREMSRVSAFETWEMAKARRVQEGYERRKRNSVIEKDEKRREKANDGGDG